MSRVPGTAAADAPVDRLTLLVWGTAMAAYVVAVAGRTSLGVAGLQAADRFSISAATLASFSVVQLAVYAAAQLPAGMVLDRVGPRRSEAWGAGAQVDEIVTAPLSAAGAGQGCGSGTLPALAVPRLLDLVGAS